MIRDGIPTVGEYESILHNDLLKDLMAYNEAFVRENGRFLWRYALHWAKDPLQLMFRRWEYLFVAQRLFDHATITRVRPFRVLDAGSGVTFMPYYTCDRIPGAEVTCCDFNPAYDALFAKIGMQRRLPVTFRHSMLQHILMPDASFEAIYCVSVLEHTDEFETILKEFHRLLVPGGLIALTFDISLDGRAQISRQRAAELLRSIVQRFTVNREFDPQRELERLNDQTVLSTDYTRRMCPELMPWRHPMLKSLYDLFKGRGWTGGFFSLTCCCLAMHRTRSEYCIAVKTSRGSGC